MKRICLLTIFSVILSSNVASLAWSKSCTLTQGLVKTITCPSQTLDVQGQYVIRTVKYSVPEGPAPIDGWPVVIIYQGSLFPVEFTRNQGCPFGGYNELRMIQSLLDHGFAVVAPPAINNSVWLTNLIGVTFTDSEDDIFIRHLLSRLQQGDFGPMNMNKLFATGLSSGGYNTSRMALAFPGMFKALAIASASYATCGGAMCLVPDQLPANHPPTLFLHGQGDYIVPISTMWMYFNRLKDLGIRTSAVVDPMGGHQWIDQAPEAVTKWFLRSSSSSSSEHSP